jgi:hypothetical protein
MSGAMTLVGAHATVGHAKWACPSTGKTPKKHKETQKKTTRDGNSRVGGDSKKQNIWLKKASSH